MGVGAGETLFSPTPHLRGHLAEGVFFVVSLDALDRGLRNGARRLNAGSSVWLRHGFKSNFCFGVIWAMVERGSQFACCTGAIPRLAEGDTQVEVIVGIARIILNRLFEIVGSALLTAVRGHDSEVVVDLG